MKSRFAQIIVVLGALLAFVPVFGVDYLLDDYVRAKERAVMERGLEIKAGRIQASAYEAIGALRTILADSPSLCTPTFIANVHKQMEQGIYLKQVLVENADGVQYCDAFAAPVRYTALSQSLSIPGRTETVTVVSFAGLKMPVLKLTQAFGTSRLVSAFVPVFPGEFETMLAGMPSSAMLRVSLTNGTQIASVGDTSGYDNRGDTEFISGEAFAGELPIRVQAAVPFAMLRALYSDLDVIFTLFACLLSGVLLVVALQYVRRSQLPAFDLERAINAGEIKPYYQPVINLKTGMLAGCEVLCRWEKKNGETVPPGAFIDYAEVTGLAIPMTLSLMQQVKADLGELCLQMPDIKVSINLFEGHFRDGSIVDDVHAIFGGSQISFRQLLFEITERRPLEDTAQAASVIAALHALGARLAMDDVGTGHSNLAYMQTLGVDVIKIDRIFVDMIKPDTQQVPVLDGLISMCRDLGTEIIAEGVETEAQALYLKARGVVMAQGFLFAPALKSGAFKQLARALNGEARGLPVPAMASAA